jgi:hypothetical protein
VTARVIRAATPPFGKLAAIEAKLEVRDCLSEK